MQYIGTDFSSWHSNRGRRLGSSPLFSPSIFSFSEGGDGVCLGEPGGYIVSGVSTGLVDSGSIFYVRV